MKLKNAYMLVLLLLCIVGFSECTTATTVSVANETNISEGALKSSGELLLNECPVVPAISFADSRDRNYGPQSFNRSTSLPVAYAPTLTHYFSFSKKLLKQKPYSLLRLHLALSVLII